MSGLRWRSTSRSLRGRTARDSSVKSHVDLGGFWQSGTVKSSMGTMPPMEGMFHMTYDPGPKQYVMLWVDNMGAYSQETSPGWGDGKWTPMGSEICKKAAAPAKK